MAKCFSREKKKRIFLRKKFSLIPKGEFGKQKLCDRKGYTGITYTSIHLFTHSFKNSY
jgi:hypothetical protein